MKNGDKYTEIKELIEKLEKEGLVFSLHELGDGINFIPSINTEISITIKPRGYGSGWIASEHDAEYNRIRRFASFSELAELIYGDLNDGLKEGDETIEFIMDLVAKPKTIKRPREVSRITVYGVFYGIEGDDLVIYNEEFNPVFECNINNLWHLRVHSNGLESPIFNQDFYSTEFINDWLVHCDDIQSIKLYSVLNTIHKKY